MKDVQIKKIKKYLAVIGLLIFLHYMKITSPIENFFIKMFNPVFSVFYSFSSDIRTNFSDLSTKKEMIKTERELNETIRELIEEKSKHEMIEKENRELRKYLNFFTQKKYEYKVSNVISMENVSLTGDNVKSITINKGLNDGVFNGLAVVSSQGVIIGKVEKASDNFSKVCLVNSDDCKFAVMVLNESEASGLTEGDFGLTIKMILIPQNKILRENEVVVTSGLEKNIPDGLIIGRIIKVDKDSVELWQTATIEPIINPGELTVVSVILPHK